MDLLGTGPSAREVRWARASTQSDWSHILFETKDWKSDEQKKQTQLSKKKLSLRPVWDWRPFYYNPRTYLLWHVRSSVVKNHSEIISHSKHCPVRIIWFSDS